MKSFKSFKVYEDSKQQQQQNASDHDHDNVQDSDSDNKENVMNGEEVSVSFPAQLFEIDRRFGTDITELVLRTENSEENRLNML